MNDSDRWVNHNLQRQRELLERQRQRRLNANLSSAVSRTISQQEQQQQQFGFSSERNAAHRSVTNIFQSSQSPVTTNSQYDSPSRTTQSRGSLYSFAGQSPSPVGVQPQIPSRSSSSQIVGNEGTFQYSQLPNPSINEPKIITVKGITPPQSRRQSDAEKQQKRIGGINGGSELRKPILNVEKLEPIGSSFNSEIDEEDRGFRGLNAQSYDYAGGGHSQRSPSSTTALASKRPSWNGDAEAEDDDGSIPTEILNEEPIESIDVAENLEQFVMDPIRKNYTLKCRITRDKHGMDKGMFPTYYLHLEKNDGRRTFLLAARKRKKTTTANYLISVDPTDLRRNGQSFIAKVRSNAMGTMFTIYDNGENPRKSSAIGEGVRRELGAVIYETNVLGLKGPRKMTIIIPGIYVDQKHNYVRPLAIRPISEKESILERFKTNRLDEMVVLNNKQPVWNEDTQSYVLNFHGRVTQASVKNFQIVHSMQVQSFDQKQRNSLSPDPNEYIIMQFGRIDCDTFTMDVRYPLSPVQAFGIAMTSFHGKLACE